MKDHYNSSLNILRRAPRGASFIAHCTIVCLSLAPSVGSAHVGIGGQAGVNVSTCRYDDELPPWSPGWRASFTGGSELEVLFNKRLSLMTGPRYVRQTNRVKYDTGPGSFRQVGEFRAVQDYLSLPVLLAVRPFPSRRLFISVGPEVSLLLSGRFIVEETLLIGSSREERQSKEDIKDKLKSTNVTLDAGLGIEFPLGKHLAVTGVRYTHGIVGVAEKSAWFSDWKTQGIESLVGIRW
jgi:hypothetical protein